MLKANEAFALTINSRVFETVILDILNLVKHEAMLGKISYFGFAPKGPLSENMIRYVECKLRDLGYSVRPEYGYNESGIQLIKGWHISWGANI